MPVAKESMVLKFFSSGYVNQLHYCPYNIVCGKQWSNIYLIFHSIRAMKNDVTHNQIRISVNKKKSIWIILRGREFISFLYKFLCQILSAHSITACSTILMKGTMGVVWFVEHVVLLWCTSFMLIFNYDFCFMILCFICKTKSFIRIEIFLSSENTQLFYVYFYF